MLSRALSTVALCLIFSETHLVKGQLSNSLQLESPVAAPDELDAQRPRPHAALTRDISRVADGRTISKDWGLLYPTYDVLRDLKELLVWTRHGGATHKPLFRCPQLGGSAYQIFKTENCKGDIVGFILVVAVLFIAAGGGIGGGGAIIPLYLLFLKFPTNIAVALGNITIVGGAISNFIFNVGRRHSFFNRPLIDWDLILVMEPSTILGALVGGYLNKTFPNWLTTILLGVLLAYISWKLLVRGVITWSKESHEQEILGDEEQPLLQDQQAGAVPSGMSTPISAAVRTTEVHFHSSPLAYASLGSLSHSLGSSGFRRISSSGNGIHGGVDRQAVPSGMTEVLTTDSEAATPHAREIEDARNTLRRSEPDLSVLVEQASLEGELAPPEPSGQDGTSLAGQGDEPASAKQHDEDHPADEEEHQKQLDEHFGGGPQVPPFKLGALVLLTAVVAASDTLKKRVPCGAWLYWLLVLSIIPAVLLVTIVARRYLVRQHRTKMAAGYCWREGDIEWTPVTTVTYPAVCSIAGLVAGMFGVGGGIVKGPLMLEMGVLPDVASATSATMIMFTAASASIVFISFGGIPLDYGVAVFLLGLVFTMLGQIACYGLMKLLHRRSVIIFAMAALMILSLVITFYEAILGVKDAVHSHNIWNWHRICS